MLNVLTVASAGTACAWPAVCLTDGRTIESGCCSFLDLPAGTHHDTATLRCLCPTLRGAVGDRGRVAGGDGRTDRFGRELRGARDSFRERRVESAGRTTCAVLHTRRGVRLFPHHEP